MPTLNWIGKQAVINHHQEVPFHLLKDVPDLSCGDAGSGNLIVEGDNLIALKALLPYYAKQVKCIYIDPPYNTGEEKWVYNDNVDSPIIRRWLGKVVGREAEDLSRHDKWLCMMYPRLALLREFLSDTGAIFVSIDDDEIANLRLLMDEIFGHQNFIAEMIWEGAFKNDARQVGVNHEYVVLYARSRDRLPREWTTAKEGAEPVLKEVARLKELHGDDYESASEALAGWFRANKAKPAFAHRRFRYIDKRGAYKEDDPTAPGGRKFDLINPRTNQVIPLRQNRGWAFDQQTFNRLVDEGRISFITETSIMVRRYFHETDRVTPQSVFYQPTRSGSERLAKLLGGKAFEFPKDETILQKFVEMATDDTSLVLDSFAGSGTTGHAILAQNSADGGRRRFILIEMDTNIARGITAERIRRIVEGYTSPKGEPIKGLGGSFRFCELGDPLFDENGTIRKSVRFCDLARHVFFTETGEPLPNNRAKKSPLLGITGNGVAVYLLYNGVLEDRSVNGGNILMSKTLALLPQHVGPKVVYAAGSRLSRARLKKERITFKQTPYAIKVK